MLRNKNILVGITGGIAAYKMPFFIRALKRAGANVQVVMTESAQKFVTNLTLSTLSGNEVISDIFFDHDTHTVKTGTWHIELGQWAHAMVIAPATANTMAKLATGYSDNAVTTVALALRCPLLISPSMDVDMWKHETTQANVARLREIGYFVLPPESGELASGLSGTGRLPEFSAILEALERIISKGHRDLEGKKMLITAGPTHEAIDPVRYIGNRSSGKMGFALANAAALRGGDVTLISGPVNLSTPRNVHRINVVSAEEMYAAVKKEIGGADILIMAAAVADFAPKGIAAQKIKKSAGIQSIELKPTTDILGSLAERTRKRIVVGFSLETDHEIQHARLKLKQKKLDIIVLNNPLKERAAFGSDTNIVTIITKSGKITRLRTMPKFDIANEILDRIVRLFK